MLFLGTRDVKHPPKTQHEPVSAVSWYLSAVYFIQAPE